MEELRDYILKLFGIPKLTPMIEQQINNFVQLNGYSYSGICKTLRYFYTIQGNNIENANGIGIVPYVYEDAEHYYKKIWYTNEHNKNLEYNEFKNTITISPPIPKRKTRELDFIKRLEESEDND